MYRDFTITKREILASVSIIAILLLIGALISGKISERQNDKNAVYNKAIKIESTDLFEYGMRTNTGNAFVYGDLETVDTVTYPELGGKYMYVEKVKEKYTMHTRTVTTTVNGKTRTKVEHYWTWDAVDREDIRCKEVSFCGVIFNSKKIELPSSYYIDTIKESGTIRYKYYVVDTKYTGTIFTSLKDKTISDNTPFYQDLSIEETVDMLESGTWAFIFWFFWIVLIAVCVYGFYYLDNEWLE